MDIILTPVKRLIIGVCLFAFFISMSVVFIRGLTEKQIPTLKEKSFTHNIEDVGPTMGEGAEHLHLFIQISDLHLSIHHDKKRGPDFEYFCNSTIPIFKPEAVIVTGDITDAKYIDKQGSIQYEEEWKQYERIMAGTKVLESTIWLDIRGNHDAFDVPSLDNELNYYKKYSIRGKEHDKSYHYMHKSRDGDTFSFIGFDACPDPGPRRPFNFFGVITEDDLASVERLEKESHASNMTIWFGHYPTSVITGDVNRLRETLGKGLVYLSGHLHTLGGLAPNMYARQQTGYLSLEVGDWMDNRIYRVFAVDHGLFSFSDQQIHSWPVVIVTNPKHGQFIVPDKEPLYRMLHSTHIRIVAFSMSPITSVAVSIDDRIMGEAQHAEGSLYTLPWDTALYDQGLHHIVVEVKDASGRVKILRQPFTLDGTQIAFNWWRRFILMSQHQLEGKTLFVLAFIGTVLPMLLCKVINFSVDGACPCNGVSVSRDSCFSSLWFYQLIIRRYKLLSNTPSVYWPLLAFHIYVAIGPWFIGDMMKGYVGAMFVYGVYVNGSFLHGSLTYLYGFFQLLLFNFPLTQYLAHVLDHRICGHKHPEGKRHIPVVLSWTMNHSLFYLMLLYQVYLTYTGTYRAYGLMAILLCPVRTWSVPFALVLRWIARGQRIVQLEDKQKRDFERVAS